MITIWFMRLRLAFRLATREMRGGLKGFYIFLACIALGTGAIAAVNSVSAAMTSAITAQGQTLLGADLRFQLNNREAGPEEMAFFQRYGTVSHAIGMRSMARLENGSDQALVEIKAVDQLYPLYGTFTAEPPAPLSELLAKQGEAYGAVLAPVLMDRLQLKPGSRILIGKALFIMTAAIKNEPDAASEGFSFAPRMLISQEAMAAAGLMQTGSIVEHSYKIRLTQNVPPLQTIEDLAKKAFPDAGWIIRDKNRAAPNLSENITRFSQFLTLVGLTALIVGGVGVANAVRAFLDAKRNVIATLKCLGASAPMVVLVYLWQILLVACLGIGAGLVLGVIAPWIANAYLADYLPVPQTFGFYPRSLILATIFGLLTTLAFAIMPLGHAREVPATALFREQGFETRRLPSWPYILVATLAIAALAGLAVYSAYDRRLALIFLAAMAGSFVVLRLVALGVSGIARRAPHFSSAALRLGIGNIHRVGAITPSVILSLGLGLTLLVALSLINGNLSQNLTGSLAQKAPNFFFVDIQRDQLEPLRNLIGREAPKASLQEVPMMRGRITAFNGEDIAKRSVPPEGRWVLRGDRGITYDENLPQNASVIEGSWWPKDYNGQPLVSFSEQEAQQLGLKLGDTVSVNVLGRTITAKIANFRKINWQSLSINFVMVFSPNTFAGAPHGYIASLTDQSLSPADEGRVMRVVTNQFPTITTVRVKDALDMVNMLVGQLAIAIRAAAGLALVTSILVLAGALAAGNRSRTHDAVVLKTLGATRPMLISAFTWEYMLLGLATAIFALFAGGVAGWYVISQVMKLPYTFLPGVALTTIALSLIITITIGLMGTWRILGQKPASVLREL